MWQGRHTPEPWRLHPYHSNIVIADNPEPWSWPEQKEVFVARNANRLPDYDQAQDSYNMQRIVSCVNFCKEYADEELNQLSLLKVIMGDPEKKSLRLHTVTPWEVEPYTDRGVVSITRINHMWKRYETVVKPDWNYRFDNYITHSNCYRIVACVNFCDGYSNEELSTMNLFDILKNKTTEMY